MKRIQSILLVTATAFSVNLVYAQTQPAADSAMNNGINSSSAPVRIITPTTDPLVQKRNDNTLANEQYRANKKAAKQEYKQKTKTDKMTAKQDYKQKVDAAKADQKQFKKDAASQEKAALNGDTTAAPLVAVPVDSASK
jgi:2-succinyl-5-enolpyruvyl-6-hydroxy-3-cyclohexene-1-carboxylate synthase